MYFQFSKFYKRDVYFEYNDDENEISQYDFTEGVNLEVSKKIYYDVDKIDAYIRTYDVLPTFGLPLVSEKFKEVLKNIEGTNVEFFPARIVDKKGNVEDGFFALNILNKISCLDTDRSIVEETSYGTLKIKKMFVKPDALDSYSIIRMEEHESYIIVSSEFKKRFEDAKLKGIDFLPEGHTIYSDL